MKKTEPLAPGLDNSLSGKLHNEIYNEPINNERSRPISNKWRENF